MQRAAALLILVLCFVFCGACSGESENITSPDGTGLAGDTTSSVDTVLADSGSQVESPTYYRDIKPLLDAMCVRCHSEGGVRASVPLDTEESATNWADAIRDQVVTRKMPPWKATDGCRDYAFDESLTDEEIQRVSAWVEGGSLPGVDTDTPVTPRPVEFANLSRIDVTVEMPVEYTPKIVPDDYRCFLLPWDADKKTYITGFGALPGNPAVVHHVIAYLIEPQAADEFIAWEEAEEEPGYTCFGGPSGPGGGLGLGGGVRFLGGWAPGGVGGDFPPGTGMPVDPGSYIALQVHYNTFSNEPQPDLTKVVFKTDETVEHEALVQPWTSYQWLLGTGMEIPAGEESVVHSWGADPFSLPVDIFGGATTGLRIYSASLHMHNLGVAGRTYIDRGDGTEECMLNIDDYDFGWQRSYVFSEPTILRKGDKLMIECEWDNSAANQPYQNGKKVEPVDQKWGEGTTDEMCIGFFYAVPLFD